MFSLITTTQGDRMFEFERLIRSLSDQTYKDFELIVVDQSSNSDVERICRHASFNTKYIKTSLISLSKARNIGIKEASGEFVAFPDDDCWYPKKLLERVKKRFQTDNIDCVCCCAFDPELKRTLSARPAKKECIKINTINALKYPISIGIFSKKTNIRFDESLGAGAKWGAGEETDYVLQLLNYGKRINYYRKILVYHPYHNDATVSQQVKTYRYGQGYGALIKKALKRKQYGVLVEYYTVILRSIGGVLYYRIMGNKIYKVYIARIRGIISGRVYS